MIKKITYCIGVLAIAGGTFLGCSHSKRYSTNGVGSVGTINVVIRGDFLKDEIDQIKAAADAIANNVSNEVNNDFDVTVEVTNNSLPGVHVNGNGNVIIINPGDFFECPDLYERLCHTQDDPDDNHQRPDYDWEGWRNRGHYISCMIAQGRGRKDCPEEH